VARPARIEYEGAFCHVMNRGNRREEIFNEIVYAGCKGAKFLKPGCLRVFPSFKMMERDSPRVRRDEMSTVRNAPGSPLNRLGALDGAKTQGIAGARANCV